MGLIGSALERGIRAVVIGAEIVNEFTDGMRFKLNAFPGYVKNTENAIESFEGPDDVWPAEPIVRSSEAQITDTASEPEVLVHEQWGLKLPDGTIMWGSWQNLSFATPMDRLLAIANLQKTAADCGFSEGEQIAQFLAHYGWVTRNQIATVVYEDTGAYALTDPPATDPGTPLAEEIQDADRDQSSRPDSDIRPGSVGGDA